MKYIRLISLMILCLVPLSVYAEKDTIYVSTSYKSLFSTPEKTGMLDRIVMETFRRIGLKAEIVFTPQSVLL